MATATGSASLKKDSTAITIYVAGKGGSGRSTLINSILGLTPTKGFFVRRRPLQAADERHSVLPKATEMKVYENKIGGIHVYMKDTPSLMASSGGKPQYYFEDFSDVDLCLFCVDMSKPRFDAEKQGEAMQELSKILKKDIWNKTVLVLTFANKYILRIEDNYVDDSESKKRKFEQQVESWKNRLQSTIEKELKLDPDIARKIKVIPVGDRHSHQLLPNSNSKWLNELWQGARSVVRPTAQQAVQNILAEIMPKQQQDVHRQVRERDNLAAALSESQDGDPPINANVPKSELF